MKDITLSIPIEPYLKQWLEHKFGAPVKFPRGSFENEFLRTRLQRKQCGDHWKSYCVLVVCIPDNGFKKPEYYHHLSRADRLTFSRLLRTLFKQALWCALLPLVPLGDINNRIRDWCHASGISYEHYDSVIKIFYRMRLVYDAHGITLHKKYN